ncbi:hypothetical protein ACFLXV_03155 [Chloroflexota bacterium]
MDTEKELWGHKFKVVNKGLDEADVYSFVDSITHLHGEFSKKLEQLDSIVTGLSNQYADLAGRFHQLPISAADNRSSHVSTEPHNPTSGLSHFPNPPSNGHVSDMDREKLENLEVLTRFAERTVIEAAKQANLIRVEIEQQARIDASNVVARAQEQAATEGHSAAAEAESTAFLRGEELLSMAQQRAADLGQYVEKSDQTANAADTSNAAYTKACDILKEAKGIIEENAQLVRQQADKLQSKSQKTGTAEVNQALETIHQQLISLMDTLGNQTLAFDDRDVTGQQISPVETEMSGDQIAESSDEESEMSGDQISESPDETSEKQLQPDPDDGEAPNSTPFDGTVELALPPPVALDRMLQLHKHLKETPHVDVLNLGGSVDTGITIRILVDNPTELLKTIGELTEVENVTEELAQDSKTVPSLEGGEDNPVRRVIVTTKS